MAKSDSIQIIPYYSQPHVFTVIDDDSQYEETVATPASAGDLPYSTAIVVGADSGIDGRFVRLTDLATKQAIFGKGNYLKYGQPSIQADVLFNGNTNVWLMRVLPDNATYANIIYLAHYRLGKVLDDLGQETGKVRLEIKFSTVNVDDKAIKHGAITDADIQGYAQSLIKNTKDPKTGYKTLPIAYVRSIGRGRYGNNYSMSITRDQNAEKEYGSKMYMFNLIDNSVSTKIKNQFSGSLILTAYKDQSLLIEDTLNQFTLGSCPVHIKTFEDSIHTIYEFYMNDVVARNAAYVAGSGFNQEDLDELKYAQNITISAFDPLFGLRLNTQIDELIPYYRNYTLTNDMGEWQVPDLEIPNVAGAVKPLNKSQWSTCRVGAKVLVAADPFNEAQRWLYTVVDIDSKTGNIVYDEGYHVEIDADQYDGIDISINAGRDFVGGHDGDFQEITVGQVTREPSAAEMKLLLSKEYVKAFRGRKDRRILSPARIKMDFLFDANYNLTSNETLDISTNTANLYNSSTVLTDADAVALSVLAESTVATDYTDLNVKQAMYDLNEFRCRNGMMINPERGAGCSLYLDCGLTGSFDLSNTVDCNIELKKIFEMMEGFLGRQTSIDLGFYNIFEPGSMRKVPVTVTYFIAKNLVKHIMGNGLNKPFTKDFAQITAPQRDISSVVAGEMIRDSFQPDIDLIDWDVKEALNKGRINYWEVSDEGRTVKRAVQNTRQLEASALLEENNVRVLNLLKKNMEKANDGYLFNWNDPVVRKGYTKAQMDIYRPWIGTMVEDLDIRFTANEWEEERMIMHCLVIVKFRNIVKRIILEINIQKPTYQADDSNES